MKDHKIVCLWCDETPVEGPVPTTDGLHKTCRDELVADLKTRQRTPTLPWLNDLLLRYSNNLLA